MQRIHKRFTAFLIFVSLLMAGFLWGPVDSFSAFSAALGFGFGAYLGGQSATDYKNGEGSFRKEG